jgi:hypothetical protein
MVYDDAYMGMFNYRAILYGENFWETLLIPVRGLATSSREDGSFQKYLDTLCCTHLLVRTELYLQFLQNNYPLETRNQLFQQMSRATEMIYNANGYEVYRLIPPR